MYYTDGSVTAIRLHITKIPRRGYRQLVCRDTVLFLHDNVSHKWQCNFILHTLLHNSQRPGHTTIEVIRMVRNLARGVFQYPQPPRIISYASTVGQKEGDGPMGSCFDCVEPDAHFGQETWEQAESVMQRRTVQLALEKSGLRDSDLSCICAGDLMNQCIGSTYGMRPLEIPLLGIYGACSTMAEGLLTASFLAAGGVGEYTAAVTSSHFSTAERQFRFPLSYGGQRPPTAQWTCTGSGAVILQQPDGVPDGVCVTGACIGIMVDLGVTDANHMGAAMAPAAADTIVRYLKATQTAPEQYDAIVTGDLGIVGSELLCDLVMKQGFDITRNHKDCGAMLYDPETQDTHAGGSGCGCSASLLCGHFLPALQAGTMRQILFAATGALMSPTASQQGESIPGISHLVELTRMYR